MYVPIYAARILHTLNRNHLAHTRPSLFEQNQKEKHTTDESAFPLTHISFPRRNLCTCLSSCVLSRMSIPPICKITPLLRPGFEPWGGAIRVAAPQRAPPDSGGRASELLLHSVS